MSLKRTIAFIMIILCVFLYGNTAFALEGNADHFGNALKAEEALCRYAECESGTLLNNTDWAPPGNSVCDWLAVSLALYGVPEDYASYMDDLKRYVEQKYQEQGTLDNLLSTEYHRTVIAVLALGGDPRSFGEKSNGETIDLIKDGIWDFASGVGKQGINGYVYALIALDSMNYEVPNGEDENREWLMEQIMSAQNEDGGFGFMPGSSDSDMTAMTLTALAPYKDKYSEEINKAIDYLSVSQDEQGQFSSFGEINSESVSQVIISLCSLGIDPEKDERFIKNGVTLMDALERFHLEDGAYCHTTGEEWDVMATEQALLALKALDRFHAGGKNIYDFSDYELTIAEVQKNHNNAIIIGALAAVVICVALIIILRRRNNAKHNQ